MNKNPQDVNSTAADNPRAVVGHNRPSLAEAARANVNSGVFLLCKEALITAIQDRRLQRPHLRVLAAIATCINAATAKAWPDRATVASLTGLSVKSVSNVVLELRGWGYLIADREVVQEAGGRSLMVYTFGHIDHEAIRREITNVILRMREQRGMDDDESSRQDGKSEFPPGREVPARTGNLEREKVPPQQEVPAPTGTPEAESSRQDGSSNNKKDNIPLEPSDSAPKAKPRTKLPEHWKPAEPTIKWARDNFVVTDPQIADEAEKFHAHHFGKGNRMADWHAAWRTWWLNGFHKFKRRRKSVDATEGTALLPFGNAGASERQEAEEYAAALERIRAEEDAERCRR